MSLDTRMPGQKMVDAIRRRDKGSHPHHRVHPVGSPGLDWPSFWCGECAVWDRRQLLLLLDAAPRAATEPPPIEVRDVYFYEAGLAEGRAEPLTRERLHEARHPFIPGAGRDAGYCDCGEIVERLAALTPTSAPEPGS